MKIEVLKLRELKPLEVNVRKHSEIQINELIRSLNQFGQTRAIVIDEDNNILIGNGLYEAMQKRGDEKVDCYRVKGLSEKDKKKLILTDNKVYSLGLDNYENIEKYVQEITIDGDFDIAGFDADILKSMTRDISEIKVDMQNYGVIDADSLKKPVIPPATPNVQGNAAEAQDTGNVTPEYTPASYTHEKQQVHSEKTVICPNCGEVIVLD